MNIKHLLNNLFIIQLLIPLFYSFSQTLSNGQITFNFNGTVDGNFNSITEDSIPTGILINQENSENSQIIIAGISNQDENRGQGNRKRHSKKVNTHKKPQTRSKKRNSGSNFSVRKKAGHKPRHNKSKGKRNNHSE